MRQLFKGGNYSREETINHLEVLTAETIQRRKLFKGGNYMRKYGMWFHAQLANNFLNDILISTYVTLIITSFLPSSGRI